MTQRTSLKHLGCLALRSNALLSAFGVILTRVFISRDFGNIMNAIISRHAPKKDVRRTTQVHRTYMNPEPLENVLILP
jgi:hypothetical protein